LAIILKARDRIQIPPQPRRFHFSRLRTIHEDPRIESMEATNRSHEAISASRRQGKREEALDLDARSYAFGVDVSPKISETTIACLIQHANHRVKWHSVSFPDRSTSEELIFRAQLSCLGISSPLFLLFFQFESTTQLCSSAGVPCADPR